MFCVLKHLKLLTIEVVLLILYSKPCREWFRLQSLSCHTSNTMSSCSQDAITSGKSQNSTKTNSLECLEVIFCTLCSEVEFQYFEKHEFLYHCLEEHPLQLPIVTKCAGKDICCTYCDTLAPNYQAIVEHNFTHHPILSQIHSLINPNYLIASLSTSSLQETLSSTQDAPAVLQVSLLPKFDHHSYFKGSIKK